MMEQERRFVRYLYDRFKGRIAIGVGYDADMSEIYPFVYESPQGNALGIVALSAIHNESGDSVYIFHFSTFDTNKGSGRIMLDELCNLADHYQVVLSLSPFTLSNGSKNLMNSKQLRSWYGSYGFEGDVFFKREPISPIAPLSA